MRQTLSNDSKHLNKQTFQQTLQVSLSLSIHRSCDPPAREHINWAGGTRRSRKQFVHLCTKAWSINRPSGERFTSPPTPSPWPRAGPGPHPRRLLERLVGHLGALLFCIVFSVPFWIDLGSISLPKLHTKTQQNLRKMMPRCLPILNSFLD